MKHSPEEKKIEQDIETLIDGDRIINFSDAVFAFAATLLILKIDLPDIPPEMLALNFYEELFALWPAYAANLLSFLIIAYYWRQHHKLFILIKRYDNKLIWLNVFLLISIAFLPFPVDLFGEYSNIPQVVVFYSASIATVGYILFAIWIYASHNKRLVDQKLSARTIEYHAWSIAAAPLVFTASIPIIFLDHVTAKVSWVGVIILLIIINRVFKRKGQKVTSPEPI